MPAHADRTCDSIDWDQWSPTMRATLMFIFKDNDVLLMVKKRGLGAGKVNAPGGKIDPGESALDCAVRETQEELLVTALEPEFAGELRFQFTDGLGIHCSVFRARGFTGEPTETDEGTPFWCPLEAIPYERMWEDDRYWLPMLLAGREFFGDFVFDGETMLDHRITG